MQLLTSSVVLVVLAVLLALVLVVLAQVRLLRAALLQPGGRSLLPLSTSVSILPCTSTEVVARPRVDFAPERILIGGRPEDWIVHDVQVCGRSQLADAGHLPGEVFGATARDPVRLDMDVVPRGGDLRLLVTYVGDRECGAVFLCTASGRSSHAGEVPRDLETRAARVSSTGAQLSIPSSPQRATS